MAPVFDSVVNEHKYEIKVIIGEVNASQVFSHLKEEESRPVGKLSQSHSTNMRTGKVFKGRMRRLEKLR